MGRSTRLRIRLLGREAAAAALVEPLGAGGIAVEPADLATVIDESQHYPYFVQVWGEALWDAVSAAAAPVVTAGTVEKAASRDS